MCGNLGDCFALALTVLLGLTIFRWVDDLSLRRSFTTPDLEDIRRLCDFLGLPLAEGKVGDFARKSTFFGFDFDVDAGTVTLT